jgi:mono/diheme cytochrome c family protein
MRRKALLCLAALLAAAPAAAEDVALGAYLASIMDCGGCHTPGAMAGKPDADHPLAGGTVGFEIPQLGIFYPPNLSPHPEAGLGRWSDAEVIRAVRTGIRPDGRELAPIMPWRSYAALGDADARALVAYLRSLPPSPRKVPGPVGPSETPPAPYFTLLVPK